MSRRSSVPTTLFLPDAHFPYEDPEALSMALDYSRWLRPNRIIFTEWLDFQTISKFPDRPKDPRHDEFEPMLEACRSWMLRFWETAARDATFDYLEGNHEYRLDKYKAKSDALKRSKFLTIKKLLLDTEDTRARRRLAEITTHPYGASVDLQGIRVLHGEIIRKNAGASARAMLDKYGCSLLMGHTHRLAVTHRTDARGTIWGYEAGCLCKFDQPYVMGVADWAQGFAVVRAEKPVTTVQLVALPKAHSTGIPCGYRFPPG